MVRAVLFALTLYALSLVFIPVIAVARPIVQRRDPVRRSFLDRCVQLWARILCWPFFKVEIEGLGNLLPRDEPCVFVANHQSFMDILSTMHLPRTFKYISKASILKIPLVGFAMRAAQHVILERGDRRSTLEVFRKAVKNLEDGASLFVFPEGTRSKNGKLIEFKAGAFSMARRAGRAVVPVTVLGTGRMMPSGREYCVYRSGAGVRIVVHPPIPAEKVKSLGDDEISKLSRAAIASALPAELQTA